MVTLKTIINVTGITSKDIYDFMLNCTDADYQRWWKGTHLFCHTVKQYPGNIGNVIYVDEYVGKYRLKGYAVIARLVPYSEMVYQIKKMVKLPARFTMKFEDVEGGINIIHIVEAGFHGIGKILDPLIRLYLSDEYEANLNAHAQEEFPELAAMLSNN
ncbi:MAG: hypothetical protein QMD11_07020 [Smithella sp.]|nr:hypothetical protein [Smithella sp.]